MNDGADYQHGGEVWGRHRFGSKNREVFLALLWGAERGLLFLSVCLPFFFPLFYCITFEVLVRYYLCMPAQSCLTLCDPMNYSPPGSSVHGIFLTRILEWVAVFSSRGPSQPRD